MSIEKITTDTPSGKSDCFRLINFDVTGNLAVAYGRTERKNYVYYNTNYLTDPETWEIKTYDVGNEDQTAIASTSFTDANGDLYVYYITDEEDGGLEYISYFVLSAAYGSLSNRSELRVPEGRFLAININSDGTVMTVGCKKKIFLLIANEGTIIYGENFKCISSGDDTDLSINSVASSAVPDGNDNYIYREGLFVDSTDSELYSYYYENGEIYILKLKNKTYKISNLYYSAENNASYFYALRKDEDYYVEQFKVNFDRGSSTLTNMGYLTGGVYNAMFTTLTIYNRYNYLFTTYAGTEKNSSIIIGNSSFGNITYTASSSSETFYWGAMSSIDATGFITMCATTEDSKLYNYVKSNNSTNTTSLQMAPQTNSNSLQIMPQTDSNKIMEKEIENPLKPKIIRKMKKYIDCLIKNKTFNKLQKKLLKHETLENFIKLLQFYTNALTKICSSFYYEYLYTFYFTLRGLNRKTIFTSSCFFTETTYLLNFNDLTDPVFFILFNKYKNIPTLKKKCFKQISFKYGTYHF